MLFYFPRTKKRTLMMMKIISAYRYTIQSTENASFENTQLQTEIELMKFYSCLDYLVWNRLSCILNWPEPKHTVSDLQTAYRHRDILVSVHRCKPDRALSLPCVLVRIPNLSNKHRKPVSSKHPSNQKSRS